MARKKEGLKKWPPYKYWTEHFLQYGELWRKGHELEKTINHSLSIILLKRNSENLTEESVNTLAEYLERGRNKAIDMLWDSGLEIYVVGQKVTIEGITIDKKYRADHFKRMADMLGARHIGVGRKSTTATKDERKDYGIPTVREITHIKRHLLLGDGCSEVSIKQIEIKKVKIRKIDS